MIKLNNVSKWYGQFQVLTDCTTHVSKGEVVVVCGPSGSGKSFFTNHMIRSYYDQGTHVLLVDVGHSYKGLCEMVNGYYFTYEEKKIEDVIEHVHSVTRYGM